MAYNNFKPTIWSKFIQREIEKKCKLVEDCWRQFEGEARLGKEVQITGIGTVTIGDYNGTPIGEPEVVADNAQKLLIDQAKFFNFMVNDVDKAQSIPGVMEDLMKEAAHRMAVTRDSFVASLAKDATLVSNSTEISNAAKAKEVIDAGILALRENDVPIEDNVVITIAPFMYQLLRDQLVELKTDNDELIRKGVVGLYDNCQVKLSNNLYNDGTDTYAMIRTKRAIAFASAVDKTEAYRPEQFFSDAVKGLNVFGGKIVRPKELYIIKAHKK